jgi:WG containing repeat
MRWTFLTLLFLVLISPTQAQRAYPVKINKKWGLIDQKGQVLQAAVYDGIAEFKSYGYAVMQRNGKVGLLNHLGQEIVPARYEDTKVLDSLLIAVMDDSEWMVIDLHGNTVLEKGYESVHIWEGRFLGFRKDGKWGIADINGRKICSPKYDEIILLEDGYFKTRNGESYGLINLQGDVIIEPLCHDVAIYNDSLFFFQINRNWGAVNQSGKEVIPPEFDRFKSLSPAFISLYNKQAPVLYSLAAQRVVTSFGYEAFQPFSGDFALCLKEKRLGLLDWEGTLILKPDYDEISPFSDTAFRVRQNNKWGIAAFGNTLLLPIEYDYIAPLKNAVFLIRQEGRYGLMNEQFETIVPFEFDRIEVGTDQARAFKGVAMTLFTFDDAGSLQDSNRFKEHFTISIGSQKKTAVRRPLPASLANNDDFVLDNFEWYFDARQNRWGLRRLDNGSDQIAPTFDNVIIRKDLGFTIVGIEKMTYFDFERTSYRFEMVYGIVNNEVGLLVTEVSLWDIRLSDFTDKKSRVARIIFEDGRQGLMSRQPIGKIIQKGYAFIGDFHDGLARMSQKGRLSGTTKRKELAKGLGNLNEFLTKLLALNSMMDYTLYDQEFQAEAQLYCEQCTWGYVDTLGQVVISPQYTYVNDFVNEVGIVELEQKWGLIGKKGNALLPVAYDGVHFLEKTNNQIIKVFNIQPLYGLIDTLGNVTVDLQYDGLREFHEGRVGVKKNNLWGYVNLAGKEVIPCQFKKINDFHEGLAAVKTSRKWGFIDQNGDVVIDFQFNNAGNFNNGLTWVRTSKGVGYINKSGDFVIPPTFQEAHDFEGELARVQLKGKYGLIATNGSFILSPKYTDIGAFDENGLAIVQFGSNTIKYGVINRSGNLITKQEFRSIEPYRQGRAAVKYKNGYGFIDTDGRLIVENKYSKVSDFSNGRAAVQKDGLCGYIDLNGAEVIPLEFSKCLDFEAGKAVVYRGYRQGGIIDTSGNYIISPGINRLLDFSDGLGRVRESDSRFYYITAAADMSVGYYEQAGKFQFGVAPVQTENRWGLINQKGIEIIPPKYDKIEDFKNGYAKVRIRCFNGLSNLEGQLIIQPEYEYISYVGEGLFRVEQGDKVGYFDRNGDWVWGLGE